MAVCNNFRSKVNHTAPVIECIAQQPHCLKRYFLKAKLKNFHTHTFSKQMKISHAWKTNPLKWVLSVWTSYHAYHICVVYTVSLLLWFRYWDGSELKSHLQFIDAFFYLRQEQPTAMPLHLHALDAQRRKLQTKPQEELTWVGTHELVGCTLPVHHSATFSLRQNALLTLVVMLTPPADSIPLLHVCQDGRGQRLANAPRCCHKASTNRSESYELGMSHGNAGTTHGPVKSSQKYSDCKHRAVCETSRLQSNRLPALSFRCPMEGALVHTMGTVPLSVLGLESCAAEVPSLGAATWPSDLIDFAKATSISSSVVATSTPESVLETHTPVNTSSLLKSFALMSGGVAAEFKQSWDRDAPSPQAIWRSRNALPDNLKSATPWTRFRIRLQRIWARVLVRDHNAQHWYKAWKQANVS